MAKNSRGSKTWSPKIHSRSTCRKLAWIYAEKEFYLVSFKNAKDVSISLLFLSIMRAQLLINLCRGEETALKEKRGWLVIILLTWFQKPYTMITFLKSSCSPPLPCPGLSWCIKTERDGKWKKIKSVIDYNCDRYYLDFIRIPEIMRSL